MGTIRTKWDTCQCIEFLNTCLYTCRCWALLPFFLVMVKEIGKVLYWNVCFWLIADNCRSLDIVCFGNCMSNGGLWLLLKSYNAFHWIQSYVFENKQKKVDKINFQIKLDVSEKKCNMNCKCCVLKCLSCISVPIEIIK